MTPRNRTSRVRHAGAILGVWLIISTFAWAHTASSRANTAIVGVLITLASLRGLQSTVIWRLNTGLSIWLAFSTVALYPSRPLTSWNNLLVALALFILSIMPGRQGEGAP